MIIVNADDTQLFLGVPGRPAGTVQLAEGGTSSKERNLVRLLPECTHVLILVTIRNKQAGSRLSEGMPPIEVGELNNDESD